MFPSRRSEASRGPASRSMQLLALLIVVVVPAVAAAGSPAPGQPERRALRSSCMPIAAECMIPGTPLGASAMRITRDPESGGWTLAPIATPGAMSREREIDLNQSAAGLFEEALPLGGVTMNLQGRFQSYSVASRGADGRLRLECTESPLSLFAWLTAGTPVAIAPARGSR